MTEFTVIVPCYNEASRLHSAEFVRLALVPAAKVLFVDDGSTDGTAQALAAICAAAPKNATLLRLPRNQGKAEAVRLGLLQALDSGATLVGFLDADLSTPVDEMLRLVAILAQRPEVQVLLASRIRLLGNSVERKLIRHYLGRIFATAASLILALDVYDTQCGAKLLRATPQLRAALAQPFVSKWIFDIELIGRLLYGSQDQGGIGAAAFAEMPLHTWRDVAGSKLRARHMLAAVGDLVLIHKQLQQKRRQLGP